ncbi:uncharacterized protein METZ01_LOCUS119074 [marine metagenome]|uniref:SDR family oxidoreductase n=1 Tax=marine metagenome TaxID=408172 RepID=A0A381XNJ6_9ZZZZ
MKNQKLCIFFNTKSLIDAAIQAAAKVRGYHIVEILEDTIIHFDTPLSDRVDLFKSKLESLKLNNLINTRLIYVPKMFTEHDADIEHYRSTLNSLLNPIALSLAYSMLCKKSSDNRIIFIGSVKGYDFNKINAKEVKVKNMYKELAHLSHEAQLDGSLNSTTKFLALNLADSGINVNLAMFGPIKGVYSDKVLKLYQDKSVSGLPINVDDISDSLDIFIDPLNTYMTGQVIKFDGGVSIW